MLVAALARDCSELIGYRYNILTSVVEEAKARKSIYVTVATELRKSQRPMEILCLSQQILSNVKNDFMGTQLQIRYFKTELNIANREKVHLKKFFYFT